MTVCTWDLQQQHFSSCCIMHVTIRHAVAVQGAGQMPPPDNFPLDTFRQDTYPPGYIPTWTCSPLDIFPRGHPLPGYIPTYSPLDMFPRGHPLDPCIHSPLLFPSAKRTETIWFSRILVKNHCFKLLSCYRTETITANSL